jgi:two-component system response regulator DctR
MIASTQILLIDDDRAWLDTLSDYLHDRGFEVSTAEGPVRGEDVLARLDFLVAVIDYHMPNMDGLELLRRIRGQRPEVAVLMLTSEDDPSVARRALEEGATAFLSKTTAPALLLRELLLLLVASMTEAILQRILSGQSAPMLPAPSLN